MPLPKSKQQVVDEPCGAHACGHGYQGAVVVEVKTTRAPTQEAREADLAESLAFARRHLALPAGQASRG